MNGSALVSHTAFQHWQGATHVRRGLEQRYHGISTFSSCDPQSITITPCSRRSGRCILMAALSSFQSVWILYSYILFVLSVSQKNHATSHLFLEYLCAAIPTLNASHVSCLVVLAVALWGNALTPLQRWRIQGLEKLKNFLINTKIFRGNAKIQLRHSDFWCDRHTVNYNNSTNFGIR